MPFIRVRSAAKSDPQHEYDIPVGHLSESRHVIVDDAPVAVARHATYKTTSRPAPKRAAKKKSVEPTTAPEGANSLGGQIG